MAESVFETPRLLVRKLESADLDAMLGVYGDPEVVRWVGDGVPLDRATCARWIEVTHKNYATRGYGMFTWVERESGAVVGFGGLVHPDDQPEAEIKYALHRTHWGRGFATEAATAILAYGAARFGLAEAIATTAPENQASHRVLLKAGMRRGALRRNEDDTFTQFFVWHAAATVARDAP
jgi:RimJ/RimL family protein N-acetyltransferase